MIIMAEAKHAETAKPSTVQNVGGGRVEEKSAPKDSDKGLHPIVAPHKPTWHDEYPANLIEAQKPADERKTRADVDKDKGE